MRNKYILIAIFFIGCLFSTQAQTNILTQRGNNQRTGSYTNEKTLTTANVKVEGFGKLYGYPVDGQVYAQPLYISGLFVAGKGKRNVLFIATEHNSIYAYDADSLTAPLWKASLVPSCPLPDANFGFRYGPYHDIKVEVGITGTPVIDSTSNTLYAVAFSKENGSYYHKIYAIDITSGNFKLNSPVTITASTAGSGDGSINGIVSFESKQQLQRPALILSKGIVYVIFAGYADTDPYHGWILGYNAGDLIQRYVFNTTPNGGEGGIWMSGQGPAVDETGDIYLATGNGDYDVKFGGTNYGDTFIRFHPAGNVLEVMDTFTPYNQDSLQQVDADVGVDAPILIPNSNILVGGSKEGKLYVMDRTSLGGYNTSSCKCDNQILQSFQAFNGHLHGSVAYWESNAGSYIYGWSENDYLKAYQRNGNTFGTTPSSQSSFIAPDGMPGGILSISSNSSNAGTGIVWGNIPLSGDANFDTVTGVLRAFDATDLSHELWNSNQDSVRDAFGYFAKFNAPIIVKGKVYQPTFSGQVVVYGLFKVTSAPFVITKEPGIFLNQNVPNPALYGTRIEFGVNKPGKVVITLFQMNGTRVKTLFQGNVNDKGSLDIDTGILQDGVYIYKMVTDNTILTRSLLVMK